MIQPIIILHTFVPSKFNTGRYASEKCRAFFMPNNIAASNPVGLLNGTQRPVMALTTGSGRRFFYLPTRQKLLQK